MPPKCELILALSVVLYLVRPVNKFEARLVTDRTHNKWRPAEKDRCTDRDFGLTGYVFFVLKGSPLIRDPTHAVKVKSYSCDDYFALHCRSSAMNVFTWYRLGGHSSPVYCITVAQESQCCWSCYSTEMITGFIENIPLNPTSVFVPMLCYNIAPSY